MMCLPSSVSTIPNGFCYDVRGAIAKKVGEEAEKRCVNAHAHSTRRENQKGR